MKRQLILLIGLFLIALNIIHAQNYLQLGDDCFNKGDYECAKKNYNAQKVDGSAIGIDVKIELCRKCSEILVVADNLFIEKYYDNAKIKYQELLTINLTDFYAKKQVELCDKNIETQTKESEEEQRKLQEKILSKTVKSWKCGDNLTAIFEDGTFTIIGTGEMYNIGFSYDDSPPWDNKNNDYRYKKMHLTVQHGVTSIGSNAFSYLYKLTSATIPNSLTSIGTSAFYKCESLSSITIPNSVTHLGEAALAYCKSLTSITIPSGVTKIENEVFYECSKLTSITIPNSETSIGNGAFMLCSSLTSITIPNSVTSIGKHAFNGCGKLTSIIIPNNVTSIGENAFQYCKSLISITIQSNIPPSVTSSLNAPANAILYVPKGSISAYREADGWKMFKNIREIE